MAEAQSSQQEVAFEFVTTNPPSPATMTGDPQTPETSAFLKRMITEDRYNAWCVDCQRNRSSHCNVSFGTFLCSDCAAIHRQTYQMHECYIKQVFGECWDTFQIRVVEVGGNKRFFDFLAYYNKEREDISVKYCSSPALYYRRMLTFWVQGKQFNEDRPAKNWTEFVVKKNETYQISDKASTVYESARTGLSSFWTKITTSATEEHTDAQATGNQPAHQ